MLAKLALIVEHVAASLRVKLEITIENLANGPAGRFLRGTSHVPLDVARESHGRHVNLTAAAPGRRPPPPADWAACRLYGDWQESNAVRQPVFQALPGLRNRARLGSECSATHTTHREIGWCAARARS